MDVYQRCYFMAKNHNQLFLSIMRSRLFNTITHRWKRIAALSNFQKRRNLFYQLNWFFKNTFYSWSWLKPHIQVKYHLLCVSRLFCGWNWTWMPRWIFWQRRHCVQSSHNYTLDAFCHQSNNRHKTQYSCSSQLACCLWGCFLKEPLRDFLGKTIWCTEPCFTFMMWGIAG